MDGLAVERNKLDLLGLIKHLLLMGGIEFINDKVVVLLLRVDEGLSSEEDFDGVFAL